MSRVRSIQTALLALVALFCFSFHAFAQSDLGTISGYVKDPTGATIPGAKVTVRNPTGLDRTTTTNDSGFYTVTNIPAATYSLTAEAPGFKKYESTSNKLDAAASLTVDVT